MDELHSYVGQKKLLLGLDSNWSGRETVHWFRCRKPGNGNGAEAVGKNQGHCCKVL